MKRFILLLFLSLSTCLAFAQGKVTIEGTFKNYIGKVYVLIGNEKDSLYTKDGKFTYLSKVAEPTITYVYVPVEKGRGPTINDFWIDKGKTIIELDTIPFKNSRFSGVDAKVTLIQVGKAQKFYSETVAQLNEIKKQNLETLDRKFKLKSLTDNFLKEYPNSFIGLKILVQNLAVYNKEELQNIYNKLPSNLKNTAEARRVRTAHIQPVDIKVGDRLPNFVQNNSKGKPVSLSGIKAKLLLIDFWASWCVPCRQDNPNLVNAYKKYKDIGFEILGVSLDTEKALWLKAIKDDGLPWLHVSDLSRWENEVALKFKIKSAPSSFLINEDGVVIAKNLRGEELTKKLAEIFSSK